jgi:hypothetical protein
MADGPERDLLERATVALERQETAFERQEKSLEQLMRRMDERDARSEAMFRELLDRGGRAARRAERSERIFVAALSGIDASMQRSVERLDEMGDAIRANTRAVLSVLDRLEAGPA